MRSRRRGLDAGGVGRNGAIVLMVVAMVIGAAVGYVVGPLWVAGVAAAGAGVLMWGVCWLVLRRLARQP